MQEDVQNRSVSLTITTAKLTGRVLKAALRKLLEEIEKRRNEPPEIPHGKQTVKELVGQNQGVSNIKITDRNIKSFERVARKYGVDYALKKDASEKPPKWIVFFKARDADALTAAFEEFTARKVQRAQKPSLLTQLAKFKALVKDNIIDRVKNRSQERAR